MFSVQQLWQKLSSVVAMAKEATIQTIKTKNNKQIIKSYGVYIFTEICIRGKNTVLRKVHVKLAKFSTLRWNLAFRRICSLYHMIVKLCKSWLPHCWDHKCWSPHTQPADLTQQPRHDSWLRCWWEPLKRCALHMCMSNSLYNVNKYESPHSSVS